MKTFATLALMAAIAGPAVSAQPEDDLIRALEAAGGVTLQLAICEGFTVTPAIQEKLETLEALSWTRPEFWKAYERGIKLGQKLALMNPAGFCDQGVKLGA